MQVKAAPLEGPMKEFRWSIPEHFNIGVDVCDKWAQRDPERIALIQEAGSGKVQRLSFRQLKSRSNQIANCLKSKGVQRGDRVGVLLGQSIDAAAVHVAVYKLGAIVVPLFSLFGPEALEFRLSDSGACALITDSDGASKLLEVRERLSDLKDLWVVDAPPDLPIGAACFEEAIVGASTSFSPVDTLANDPAVIIYTSGTTGKPKGALHAHRTLLGHLPGVEMSHGGTIDTDAVFWTPADWAWIGGLLDVLLPALHHGVPVVARRFAKFDAADAFDLMARHRVTNVFLPPTALKMLRAVSSPRSRWDLQLRSIASGGESLGTEMLAWGREELGISINEFYGQTECNMIVSSCTAWFASRPGAIGKPVPGHEVAIVDRTGTPLPTGYHGQIAVRFPDPVMFLEYWNNAEATEEKFAGGYLLTGDQGKMDGDGYIYFVGRDDDVITSAGYRIGPGPIEDCLLGHPAVHMVAVVGEPDDERTEVVKAFVVLAGGFKANEDLTKELQAHVRVRLAAHEYPRVVCYVTELPMTPTGKIIRRALRKISAS
ncbi:acetyl-CoA synthetase [Variovorax boronicumulans]|uniref:acyl-CoA synthetase n=1 Tax=Variovorax boronicumulans TaxID=436515 RepID=UPI00278A6851|nr:acyl-CoA synthetase [Variovorax boronicumulans]MDP9995705.1 acetyl-CoA synthetase [Variovorax boronicumulans]MDQ0006830.1 acetyl-CoA synthetase [Variovorax boronicumulans]